MSDTARWDENGTNSAEPPEQYKTDGLPEGVPLPYTYLNWILAAAARSRRSLQVVHASEDISNQVVNTAVETDFTAGNGNQYTLPAGTIDTAKAKLQIRLGIDYSIAAACNLTILGYVGAGAYAIAIFPLTGNGHLVLDFDVVLVAPGATANGPYRTVGISDEGNEVTVGQSANIDTTIDQLIKVSATFSVADAGNDAIMEMFEVAVAQGI